MSEFQAVFWQVRSILQQHRLLSSPHTCTALMTSGRTIKANLVNSLSNYQSPLTEAPFIALTIEQHALSHMD